MSFRKYHKKRTKKLSDFLLVSKSGSSQEQNEDNQNKKFFVNNDKLKRKGNYRFDGNQSGSTSTAPGG